MALYSVQDLTCTHGLLTAVRGISFKIDRGDVLYIIGANGAGKTTLMRSLAGIHPPAEGSIALHGTDVTTQRGCALAYRCRPKDDGCLLILQCAKI